MGYGWVLLGDAELPASSVDAWLARHTEPHGVCARLDPAVVARFGLDPDQPDATTVREILALLAAKRFAEASHEGGARVRVWAAKDGDVWGARGGLVAAFVLLAEHGGRGRLVVVGDEVGPDEGFRLEVGSQVRLTGLDAREVAEVRASPAYREVDARLRAAFPPADFERPRAPSPPPAPGSYLDHVLYTVAGRALPDARDGLKRIHRHVLWTLHAAGPLEPATLAERARALFSVPGDVATRAMDLLSEPPSKLRLVEGDGARLRLAPMAAEALAEVARKDPAAFTDGKGADTRVLSLPVPWIFVAGAQAVAVGFKLAIDAVPPAALLEAALDRIAVPSRTPRALLTQGAQPVLVDGVPTALGGVAILDAYLAHRRATLAPLEGADLDGRLAADLRRWLG